MGTHPRFTGSPKPLIQTEVAPVEVRSIGDGAWFVDFGRAAFGTLLIPPSGQPRRMPLVVHLGEKLADDGRIDREPPGTIRYARIEHEPASTLTRLIVPADPRNTGRGAIAMPPEIGEVYPFRYAEVENADGLDPAALRQIAVHYPFDDAAASFASSDPVLNAVYDLCKYSIKATTFCGVYVDGDRERIPYEADAYVNQLAHYGVDAEYGLARYTQEYLLQFPTWPTEWQLCSVLIAWTDYLYTGQAVSLDEFYDDLCAKTLIDLARDDGLISTETGLCTREFEEKLHLWHDRYVFSHGLRDIVDWPPGSFTQGGQGERDNHEMMPINTVVNAFHCQALSLMSRIAGALERAEDQKRFARQATLVRESINRLLFDEERGVYIDGEGSEHASLHSNMFMLAFGLVPAERRDSVVEFVASRGMACSVYASHFLLEALYLAGEAEHALGLMTAQHDRGWWNMIRSGSTITLEAWDWRYKNNLDWNHAWGAAPASVIPRFVLGVRPLEPGFAKALIQPQPGSLRRVSGIVPTIHGPISVELENDPEHLIELRVEIPDGVTARVGLPMRHGDGTSPLLLDGQRVEATVEGNHLYVGDVGPGRHVLALGPRQA
jgi:alpha-L-rhamnosidase